MGCCVGSGPGDSGSGSQRLGGRCGFAADLTADLAIDWRGAAGGRRRRRAAQSWVRLPLGVDLEPRSSMVGLSSTAGKLLGDTDVVGHLHIRAAGDTSWWAGDDINDAAWGDGHH